MPQYQGVWNLAQQAQALTRQQWVTDPLFDYTTLLLQADNVANGAQNNTFLDSSTANGGLGFPITRNGGNPGMSQGSFSPFSQQPGYWGAYFNGSTDYLATSPTSAALNLSTGDFTIEAWVYCPSLPASYQGVITAASTAGVSGGFIFGLDNTGKPYIGNGLVAGISGSTPISANTWTHIAAVKSGSNVQFYANGVANGSAQAFSPNSAGFAYIGANPAGGDKFTGYVSNARITKGGALYTSNFTPSTIPFTTTVSVGTVSLLICQDNRFRDVSSNAFTITVNGTPSVQAFSPFAPQYQYTPTVTGGSGYFDGTGDFLSSTSTINFSNNDFTVEFWLYPTVSGTQMAFACATNNALQIQLTGASSHLNVSIGTYGVGNTLSTTGAPIKLNQWNHVVLVRETLGTNGSAIFINGSRNILGTVGTTYVAGAIHVGAIPGGTQAVTGYLSGMVVTNGTANYSVSNTSIPVPTAPPSPTGSTLCLNFTNAGILDGTMKNDLETLGNAQVSTSIVKYGSGSMYFDGTGDSLSAPNSVNYQFGSGDFTIEAWVNFSSVSGEKGIVSYFAAGTPNAGFTLRLSTGNSPSGLRFVASGASDVVLQAAWTPSTSTWYHVAVVRLNNTLTAYINGVSIGSTSITITIGAPSAVLAVGTTQTVASSDINGYIDDLRITKGIARYTRNFTPPQVALPRQ